MKVVNTKTPASIHTIKQQEVCSLIDVKPQNLFYYSNKSNEEQREGLLQCLKDANQELETELKAFQLRKSKQIGLMNTKKEDLANEYRKLEKKYKDLEAKTLEDVMSKALESIPLDIKKRLGL